jgi:hypothetical protein
MMPFPPDAVRLSAVGFVLLGFFGVAYMRGNTFKSKVLYVLLLFLIFVCALGAWFAIASASLVPDMQTYPAGRPVRITMNVFGAPYSGGVFTYQLGPYPFEKKSGLIIYKLSGSDWQELDTDCSDCVFVDCVDGGTVERRQSEHDSKCSQLSAQNITWDQTVYSPVVKYCGGKPYTTHEQAPAGPGRYKAEFCYGKAFNFDWDAPYCTPFQNAEPVCAEANFLIR